jgi:NAD(P)-dependent dehydrogenase (short-subunit alcohol dehydrogenase family)
LKNLIENYIIFSLCCNSPSSLHILATDGIGKAMAFEFARKGCNVLLISRSLDKLVATKAEINAKYSEVQVCT